MKACCCGWEGGGAFGLGGLGGGMARIGKALTAGLLIKFSKGVLIISSLLIKNKIASGSCG